jgi:hypothetical protein
VISLEKYYLVFKHHLASYLLLNFFILQLYVNRALCKIEGEYHLAPGDFINTLIYHIFDCPYSSFGVISMAPCYDMFDMVIFIEFIGFFNIK